MNRPSRLPVSLPGLLFLALFAVSAMARELPAGVEEVATVEGINEYRLDNGLRVLLFPDESKPTVTVNITYLVGSRHELYGETGMAHLLEHLLFKGTPTHPDIPGEMRRRGIGFNASAWLDRTNYFGSFTADDATLDWLLALEADRMVHSNVARTDLDSEMTVVRNEMERGENDPVRVLLSRVASTAYLWHNYGNSTIGARADVENMPIEKLQAFYRRHYRPDNATLLVAGRIDAEATLERVVAHFAGIPRPEAPLAVTYTREPTQDGEREVTVRRSGEARYVGVQYHVPASRHADFAALAVLANVLGDTPTGRLHKALVEGDLATFVSASSSALAEPGRITFVAQAPKDGDADALERQLLAMVEDVAAQPVTAAEVADAQRRFARSAELTINDANRLAMSLTESIAQGDWRLFFLQRDRIAEVSADDVNRVAATYLKRANRTLGRFIPTDAPDRADIPDAPALAEVLAGYTGRAAVAAGEAFDPSPRNIDARTAERALANGTRLVLLPKSTRGGTVVLTMNLRFGTEEDVFGRSTAASFAGSMLSRGSKVRSREDIARRLDALKAQLNFSGGAQSVTVYANTTREFLPELVELIAELLQQPAFPESEFEQLRRQAITSTESARAEPQSVAGNATSRHFNPWPKGHPYYAASFDEQLADLRAVTLDEVRAFHADFYGAGDGEISVVGDFDADRLAEQFAQHFGGWTRPQPFVRIPNPYHPVEAARVKLETPDKANATLLLRADLPISDTHPDYPALLAGNYVLGGGSMKSRLADRIRQQDGLSYSVGSGFTANAEDERGAFSGFAIAAPQNVARVEAAFHEEVARLLADGVDADELRDAIDGMLKARQRSRAEDANLVAQLRGNAYLGRTMQWSEEVDQQIAALDVDTVNAALRRHLGAVQFSLFTAGDFAGAPASASEAARTDAPR
jgi:zinc protease